MAYESLKNKKKRVQAIIRLLKKYHPNVRCELNYENPLELLVAVILSAQCTDKRVNTVTPALFKKYKTAKDYAQAPVSELEKQIHSTGFYKNKARNIINCMKIIDKKHKGQVPSKMEDLVELAGVGRKTANVVLGSAFGQASGVVVDTHMARTSKRLHLVKEKSPEKIEQALNRLIPRSSWIFWSYAMVIHGRYVCKARKPLCEKCFLVENCPRVGL